METRNKYKKLKFTYITDNTDRKFWMKDMFFCFLITPKSKMKLRMKFSQPIMNCFQGSSVYKWYNEKEKNCFYFTTFHAYYIKSSNCSKAYLALSNESCILGQCFGLSMINHWPFHWGMKIYCYLTSGYEKNYWDGWQKLIKWIMH